LGEKVVILGCHRYYIGDKLSKRAICQAFSRNCCILFRRYHANLHQLLWTYEIYFWTNTCRGNSWITL